jgi:ATP-binding cassette, subfamily B, multidrug efflux pump
VLPFLFYATFWFKGKVRVAFLNVRDQIARLNSFVQEHINGMAIVQLFNREEKQKERFESINADHSNAHLKTIFYFSIFWPLVEVLASLAMALVVWYGGARALMDQVTFGVLLAFIQYVRQFFNPIRGLSEKYNTLQSALASSERIFNVLDTPNKVIETKIRLSPGKISGKLSSGMLIFATTKIRNRSLKMYHLQQNPVNCLLLWEQPVPVKPHLSICYCVITIFGREKFY